MLELATMLSLLEDVRWWQPADELRRAFYCAQTLVETKSLSGLAESRDALAWLSDHPMSLLRPSSCRLRRRRS